MTRAYSCRILNKDTGVAETRVLHLTDAQVLDLQAQGAHLHSDVAMLVARSRPS